MNKISPIFSDCFHQPFFLPVFSFFLKSIQNYCSPRTYHTDELDSHSVTVGKLLNVSLLGGSFSAIN